MTALFATFVIGAVIDQNTDDAGATGARVGAAPASWDKSAPESDRVVYAALAAVAGCPQLASNRDGWVLAVAISIAESGADPTNFNPVPPDLSYGLWQINMLGSLGPPHRAEYGLAANEELFQPVVNARAMCSISGGGINWRPWSTYTNYAYWDHMGDAEQAVAAAQTGQWPTGGTVHAAPPTGSLVEVGPCARPAGCELDASWAPGLEAALQDAALAGFPMVIISANRTFAEQYALYSRNCPVPSCPGGLTAVPGTSNHEGGQAVDLAHADGGGLAGPGDGAWEWLHAHGPAYGVYQDAAITSRDSVHFSATGN